MKQSNCENCPMRKKYDTDPRSLAGRLWKWHIRWCPGWKSYLRAADPEKREALFARYGRRSV